MPFLFPSILYVTLTISVIAFPEGEVHEGRSGRDKSWGPGFEVSVAGPVTITLAGSTAVDYETGKPVEIKEGDELLYLQKKEALTDTASMDVKELDRYLSGNSGTETTAVLRRKKPPKPDAKKPEYEEFAVRIPRTVQRNGTYYPDFEYQVDAKVKVGTFHPDSPASKNPKISKDLVIEAAGKAQTMLTPVSGPTNGKRAHELLSGGEAESIFVRFKGQATPVEIKLHPRPGIYEELPPPPQSPSVRTPIPLVANEQRCSLTELKALVMKVTQGIASDELLQREINDDFSEKLHQRFINALDPDHLYFQSSDITEFAKHMLSHDDDIKQGVPWFPMQVHKVLLERMNERLAWTDKVLAEPFDPDKEEVFIADRSKLPYPTDEANAQQLWATKIRREVVERLARKDTLEQAKNYVREKHRRKKAGEEHQCWSSITADFLNHYAKVFGPFTSYHTPGKAKRFQSDVEAASCGIGVHLHFKDERIIVQGVMKNSPAAKAGIKAGDEVVAIGHNENDKITVDEFGTEWVGEKFENDCGTPIYLGIRRAGESNLIEFNLVRAKFPSDEVKVTGKLITFTPEPGKKPRKIGFIRVPSFYANSFETDGVAGKTAALLDRELKGAQAVFIDLRFNPGGDREQAVKLASLFLAPDQPVLQQREQGKADPTIRLTTGNKKFNGPVIPLTGHYTASASEIFAAAIQDSKRGFVIGDVETVGKAQVQTTRGVANSAAKDDPYGQIKTTVANYYRATGKSPLMEGVKADITFPTGHPPLTELQAELALLPPIESLPSAFKHPPSGIPKVEIDILRKAHETRMRKESFKKYLEATAFQKTAQSLTSQRFSKKLFEEELTKKEEAQAIIQAMAGSESSSIEEFAETPYGREILTIAFDYLERRYKGVY